MSFWFSHGISFAMGFFFSSHRRAFSSPTKVKVIQTPHNHEETTTTETTNDNNKGKHSCPNNTVTELSDRGKQHNCPNNNTVRLNVGGRIYQVARSTLELHADTFLARLIDKTWAPDDTVELFIDRNGDRFKYVLDWMRDGTVHLPVTESAEAVRKELEYFGFENVQENSVVAGVLNDNMISGISENSYDAIDKIDEAIHELKEKKKQLGILRAATQVAHVIFIRSLADGGCTTIKLKQQEEKDALRDAVKSRNILDECLAKYNLKVIEVPGSFSIYTSDDGSPVTVRVKRE